MINDEIWFQLLSNVHSALRPLVQNWLLFCLSWLLTWCVCVLCPVKRTGYYKRSTIVRAEKVFKRENWKADASSLLYTTFRYIPIDRPMTRQRQSWQQLMVVVTAGMTLTLMLTTSIFPCDGAAPPAGPSSSAAGVHDAAGLYCDFEDQQCRYNRRLAKANLNFSFIGINQMALIQMAMVAVRPAVSDRNQRHHLHGSRSRHD